MIPTESSLGNTPAPTRELAAPLDAEGGPEQETVGPPALTGEAEPSFASLLISVEPAQDASADATLAEGLRQKQAIPPSATTQPTPQIAATIDGSGLLSGTTTAPAETPEHATAGDGADLALMVSTPIGEREPSLRISTTLPSDHTTAEEGLPPQRGQSLQTKTGEMLPEAAPQPTSPARPVGDTAPPPQTFTTNTAAFFSAKSEAAPVQIPLDASAIQTGDIREARLQPGPPPDGQTPITAPVPTPSAAVSTGFDPTTIDHFEFTPRTAPEVTGAKADLARVQTASLPEVRALTTQVAIAIVKADNGKLDIRLDPPELGRLSVTLSHDNDTINAVIAADKADTQDLLRRHADMLQRAMREAGYTDVNLEFSTSADRDQDNTQFSGGVGDGEKGERSGPDTVSYARAVASSGLDIRL